MEVKLVLNGVGVVIWGMGNALSGDAFFLVFFWTGKKVRKNKREEVLKWADPSTASFHSASSG